MAQYVYRPADNRTPVNHPVFGHLEYGTKIESDTDPGPDFERVASKQPAARKSTAIPAKPAAKQLNAGKAGRS